MPTPDPTAPHPVPGFPVTYVKPTITRPNIEVGDFTYYSGEDFESRVTHHYDFYGDKLVVGKFCQIASGVEFVMNGANHRMNSASTFPFYILEHWGMEAPPLSELPCKGDTVIGNDVWIGQNATILPGVHVGDGAIIGMDSVVGSDVEPYAIVAGNPAKPVRKRFDDELIGLLERFKWWDKPTRVIQALIPLLNDSDLDSVKRELMRLQKHMDSGTVLELCKMLEENGISVWIDGGWGVDALLCEQTRMHGDLDIAVHRKDSAKLRQLLENLSYREEHRSDSSEFMYVLKNDCGKCVDVHVFEYDESGQNTYGIEYPFGSLAGAGTIDGQKVNCIAPGFMLQFKTGYEPKEKDFLDVRALCEKFGFELPGKYAKSDYPENDSMSIVMRDAMAASERIWQNSMQNGTDKLTLEDINAEIDKSRAAMKQSQCR